jgi:methylglutaconyl-CoA hydratase
MSASIEIRRPSPHVAEVWLSRPEVRNAFNETVIAEITHAFHTLGAEGDLRAIVLAAQGKAFCAGADLAWMQRMAGYTWGENHADAKLLADMLWAIYRCPVPVIARVQGDCYGGGVGLAAVCDIVVAAEEAAFCLSEAKLGLLPGTVGPYVIRAIGEMAARRYFVTAERIPAAEAHRLGLVHAVATRDELDATVQGFVAAISQNGPQAVRACKRLVQDFAGRELDEALRNDSAKRIADIRASDEGREGVQAFLQKRKPGWL